MLACDCANTAKHLVFCCLFVLFFETESHFVAKAIIELTMPWM